MGVSALHEYADALGAGFAPFVPACVEAASSLLGYKFHPRVRTSSAFVMGDAVKALVAAAKAGEQGGEASAASLVGSVLKPLSEAVQRMRPRDLLTQVSEEITVQFSKPEAQGHVDHLVLLIASATTWLAVSMASVPFQILL